MKEKRRAGLGSRSTVLSYTCTVCRRPAATMQSKHGHGHRHGHRHRHGRGLDTLDTLDRHSLGPIEVQGSNRGRPSSLVGSSGLGIVGTRSGS
jgi:hypothetical protein